MIGVMVDRNKSEEIYIWLEQQGLKQSVHWKKYTISGASKMRFSFYNEEHAAWFKLRWS